MKCVTGNAEVKVSCRKIVPFVNDYTLIFWKAGTVEGEESFTTR
jgi:hypothetical protein